MAQVQAPWSTRLASELLAMDVRATQVAHGLSLEQLNWNPRPESWSIGQCLQHLLLANQVYLPAIADALDGRVPRRVEEISPGWFARWFMRTYIEPNPKGRRVAAPRKIVPAERIELSILEAFLCSNEEARELVARAAEFDVNCLRFKNPFLPMIRFTVGTGLEILSRHQLRHLLQAERVRNSPNFPEVVRAPA